MTFVPVGVHFVEDEIIDRLKLVANSLVCPEFPTENKEAVDATDIFGAQAEESRDEPTVFFVNYICNVFIGKNCRNSVDRAPFKRQPVFVTYDVIFVDFNCATAKSHISHKVFFAMQMLVFSKFHIILLYQIGTKTIYHSGIFVSRIGKMWLVRLKEQREKQTIAT